MSHVTDCLRVYETRLTLARVGRANDGGYVMAMGFTYDSFLSGGINGDNSFELGALGSCQGLTCHAYDPSGNGGPHADRYHFHAENVPVMVVHDMRNALVKLDIEGDEWDWLEWAPLENVAQLVVELHSPHLGRWSWDTLARLASTHVLVWAHGNNWDGIVNVDGVRVPGTLETSWVRRDLVGLVRRSSRAIPGPLDMPNRPDAPDHVIDWEPFVGWTP